MSSGFSTYRIMLTDESIRTESGLLNAHWKCFTSEVQEHLIPILKKILRDHKLPKTGSLLEELVEGREEEELLNEQRLRNTINIMNAFKTLLKLDNLGAYILKELTEICNKRRGSTGVPALAKKEKQFEPLNALHPSYKIYYMMAECYGEMMEYEESAPSEFFRPPRLFVRGEELAEYQNVSSTQGILLLAVEGSYVVGKRGLAVANGNTIEWWMRKSDGYGGILGELEPVVNPEGQNNTNPPAPNNTQPSVPAGQPAASSAPAQQQRPAPKRLSQESELELDHVFLAHEFSITALSLSYDEFYLLSAGIDNIIKLWCLRSKMVLTQYKGHYHAIWSVNFSQCGYFFLSAGGDKSIRLWKTDSPVPARMLMGHQSDVYKADFMKNPDYAISCSADKTVRIWDINKAECIRIIFFDNAVLNFTLSLSGRFLVTSQTTGMMTLLDLLNGHEINTFNLFFLKRNKEQGEKPTQPIHDMNFSPDEKEFACVTKKEIAIYSLETMKEKKAVDVYDVLREERKINQERDHYLRPKEVLDLGTDLNLIYCRYHSKGQLVVAGRK